MANSIVAGNSSNGGTAITTDTSGTLNIVTGSGSGSNAITIDASQNVVFSGNVSGNIKSGTVVTSTSGTSIDFTGIPSTAKRITIMFSGVSTSGTTNMQIQLGDSGGVETSGYTSISGFSGGVNGAGATNISTGFVINTGSSAASIYYGTITISLLNSSTFSWVSSHVFGMAQGATFYSVHGGGNKSLSDILDRVRITTVNGTDTFDAGSINILYE